MSRRARMRSGHPRRSAVNSVEIAINGSRRLSAEDVNGHHALMVRARDEFCRGQNCALHWDSLADCNNMAETFAAMGIGRGEDADRVLQAAQQALSEVRERHATRGTWTLYADEIDALTWLVQLHHLQMGACSYREFAHALDRTRERMAQALAGNAPAGAIVIVGQIAQHPSATGAP